jgi:hypothetical protein
MLEHSDVLSTARFNALLSLDSMQLEKLVRQVHDGMDDVSDYVDTPAEEEPSLLLTHSVNQRRYATTMQQIRRSQDIAKEQVLTESDLSRENGMILPRPFKV